MECLSCIHVVRLAGELRAQAQPPGLSVRVLAELQQGAGLPVRPAGEDPPERLE